MTTTFDIDEARGRWPDDASELPADAQAAFAAWSQAPATAVKAALERDAAWRGPGAGISYRKLDKARDLVPTQYKATQLVVALAVWAT